MSASDRAPLGASPRSRVRRLPERAVDDRRVLYDIIDAALVGYVAVVEEGQPFVLPVAIARRDDTLLFHGSSGSRLMRTLAAGAPTCLTITHVDGLVLARSAFESSMNYRSAMVLGTARHLRGADADDALRRISDHLLPGRWADIRPPSRKELAATIVLGLPLAEASVKVRSGDPEDPIGDVDDPQYGSVWVGTVPTRLVFDTPVAGADCVEGAAIPDYVSAWVSPPSTVDLRSID